MEKRKLVKIQTHIISSCPHLLVTFFLLQLLCMCNVNKTNGIKISGFNELDWKQDSLGCKLLRLKQYNILLQDNNKVQLIGKSREELTIFLGRPNESNNNIFYYYIVNGPQCDSVQNKNLKLLLKELKKVVVDFEDNKVSNVRAIIP